MSFPPGAGFFQHVLFLSGAVMTSQASQRFLLLDSKGLDSLSGGIPKTKQDKNESEEGKRVCWPVDSGLRMV